MLQTIRRSVELPYILEELQPIHTRKLLMHLPIVQPLGIAPAILAPLKKTGLMCPSIMKRAILRNGEPFQALQEQEEQDPLSTTLQEVGSTSTWRLLATAAQAVNSMMPMLLRLALIYLQQPSQNYRFGTMHMEVLLVSYMLTFL